MFLDLYQFNTNIFIITKPPAAASPNPLGLSLRIFDNWSHIDLLRFSKVA